MLNKKSIAKGLVVIVVLSVILPTISYAYILEVIDDFEDGDVIEYTEKTSNGGAGTFGTGAISVDGANSGKINPSSNGWVGWTSYAGLNGYPNVSNYPNGSNKDAEAFVYYTYLDGDSQASRFMYAVRDGGDGKERTGYSIQLDDVNNQLFWAQLEPGQVNAKKSVGLEIPNDEWLKVRVVWKKNTTGDFRHNVTLYQNNGTHWNKLASVEQFANTYRDGGIRLEIYTNSDTNNLFFDNITRIPVPSGVIEGPIEGENLDLEMKNWMPHDTSQDITVKFTASNGSILDVTNSANITSSNTSVATVNGNTITSTSNLSVNKKITITARYSGANTTESLTVANRTLKNIGIMPTTVWLTSFFGIGSGVSNGIGSEIQWLFVIIFLMMISTYLTRNAFVGIGIGIISAILFWVSTWVSFGITLSIVFFGIFLALNLIGTRNERRR